MKIKFSKDVTKFKIRCSRVSSRVLFVPAFLDVVAKFRVGLPIMNSLLMQYLYTLNVNDTGKAKKLIQSLPPGLQRKDIGVEPE